MDSCLSPIQREYLTLCGIPKRTVARCNPSTRLYHDLGFYGEIADNCIAVLVNHYRVDMSGFVFEDFFPPEFPGSTPLTIVLLWLTPFASWIFRCRQNYSPLTLEAIEKVISAGSWRLAG
jgi:hypothetical protein